MQIQEWLDKIQRADGTKLKIKNVLSTIFSHGVRWELVERNPVCGQGGSPGHRGASTGVRQSNRISIRRVTLAPDVVRRTLEQLPLREATMALVDAVTALRASELIALKWKNVGWETGILQSRIRISRRRTEGNEEQEQPAAASGTGATSASSLAGAHALPLRRGLDFRKSALPWRDSVYPPDSLPATHSSCNRKNRWNREQQASTDRVAHVTPITSNIADLERRECEGYTVSNFVMQPQRLPWTSTHRRFRRISRKLTGRSSRWCFRCNFWSN